MFLPPQSSHVHLQNTKLHIFTFQHTSNYIITNHMHQSCFNTHTLSICTLEFSHTYHYQEILHRFTNNKTFKLTTTLKINKQQQQY